MTTFQTKFTRQNMLQSTIAHIAFYNSPSSNVQERKVYNRELSFIQFYTYCTSNSIILPNLKMNMKLIRLGNFRLQRKRCFWCALKIIHWESDGCQQSLSCWRNYSLDFWKTSFLLFNFVNMQCRLCIRTLKHYGKGINRYWWKRCRQQDTSKFSLGQE